MKLFARHLTAAFFVILLYTSALSQRRGDPLNPEEIDQLRDTAVEPEKRMKLFVAFARARLVALEQMRSNPKTHQLLQEFVTIYDELNDNLENFDERKADLRKAIKTVIEGDTEFQAKLRALKDDTRGSKDEAAQYQFILSNAIESVDSSAEDHRKMAAEQEEVWKHRKKEK
jgi:hypothetical protein